MATRSDTEIPAQWLEPTIHSLYFVALLRTFNAPPELFAKYANITPTLHSFLEMHTLIEETGIRGDTVQGIRFGASVLPTEHGLMGQALMSANTLRDSLQILRQFCPIRNRLFRYGYTSNQLGDTLTITPNFAMGAFENFVTAATLLTFARAACIVLGPGAEQDIMLDVPWPDDARQAITNLMGLAPPKQSRGTTASLFITRNALLRPNPARDPVQFDLAVRGCQDELARFEGGVTSQVKAILMGCDAEWFDLRDVAGRLHMSRRTLIRKLKAENTSFMHLLDDVRCNRACWHLRRNKHSIAEIALRLGYQDESNFSRTFRKWKCTTPTEYRYGGQDM